MLKIICECGNETFRLYWDEILVAECTGCGKKGSMKEQPFTIRMP